MMTIPSKAQLETIAKRYGLRLIVLFGSQVIGRTHPESDVDVAVWTARPLTSAWRTRLWMELSDAFQMEIDLAVLNQAEPLLLSQVARKGKLLYENKRWAWEEFKGYAFRYFEDTQKYRDDLTRYLKRELQGTPRAG
ncbi:MAG: type VII toxin-antitoxin system MntA family adenylyltransferase antitoxin [Anaerolineae bacterium]